ncbi:antigen 5 like allergen Cul n 1 [Drosophila guanche]|uniref:Blast:Venom allergen 5 n=1 Tax=Drosophila guanche TaxID=7266 RepID=A0A3B0J4Z5_DROGU|nr:antigen 5 like allergen Cul n 1 [Drosophila guanche]SPP76665.1 blast:Venom allergen 5 [Drosophila guanche]
MQQWPFVLLSFGLLWLSCCLAIDFCEVKACQGMTHLGCNNSMKFDQSCMKDRRLVNMEMYRSYLLAMHNTYRQKVASGEISGLPKAQHMPELVWDIYLALVAEYHLKRCLRELNDVCVATDDFPEPAVNYGDDLQSRALHLISNMRQVTFLTESWLHEVYQLQSIHTETAPRAIRHIINDRATHMGCAAGQNYDNRNVRFVLICYYDGDAPRKQNLYISGDFNESQCTAGRSQRYANLCGTLPKNV